MNSKPKLALFLYSEPGYACLKELLRQGQNIAIIFTHFDDTNERQWFHSVYELAKKAHIPVYRSRSMKGEALQLFEQAKPDLVLSVYYRAIIPNRCLEVPLGAFNIHGSLLPRYRGRACINWAILKGEKRTGITLHEMTKWADKGDIIAQQSFPINTLDTAYSISKKVSHAVPIMLEKIMPHLLSGDIPRQPQDEDLATKFGRRRPADGCINWKQSANDVYNLIRAVAYPFPGAFSFSKGRKLYIWWGLVLAEKTYQWHYGDYKYYQAGTVRRPGDGTVLVKCGRDWLIILRASCQEGKNLAASSRDLKCFLSDGQLLK